MDRFIEHNRHWESPKIFAEQDPHLLKLKRHTLVHEPDLIYELPYLVPGIYTLSGGRQIGKTTLLKQWMKYLITEKADSIQGIFFMTGEMISDHVSLNQLVRTYLDKQKPDSKYPGKGPYIIIIDEVTYIKNWDQGIKYLADSGVFENMVVMLTGSDTTVIKEARMRFPGRRGMADKADFHLYPLSFFEFMRLKHKDCINPSHALLLEEFENGYLQHGGFLTAINDYANNQKIELATYRTYSDWVRGDVVKRNLQESYLLEVLRAIIKTYGTQVSWDSLAKHTSISHHDTVRQYVELLESMDVIFVQYALLEDKLAPAPKKHKKIIFKDPFMYRALYEWAFSSRAENDDLASYLAESSAISHYLRFYPCYYIKAEGEVDLAYVYQGHFFPVEIKWRKQLRSQDIKQISKYKKNGLILNHSTHVDKLNDIPLRFLAAHIYNLYIRERLEEFMGNNLNNPHIDEQIKIVEKLLGRKSLNYQGDFINCFAYALGLDKSRSYIEIASSEKTMDLVGIYFVQYLLKNKVLEELESPAKDSVVIYFNNREPKHAGVVRLDKITKSFYIESNAETFGRLFLHELWDVPKSYGNEVKYYIMPDWQKVETYFLEYCRELQRS